MIPLLTEEKRAYCECSACSEIPQKPQKLAEQQQQHMQRKTGRAAKDLHAFNLNLHAQKPVEIC